MIKKHQYNKYFTTASIAFALNLLYNDSFDLWHDKYQLIAKVKLFISQCIDYIFDSCLWERFDFEYWKYFGQAP